MKEIVETGFPAIITILGAVVVWIRLFIRTTNKTIVDMIVESRSVKLWDEFLELVLLSSVLVIMLLVPVFYMDMPLIILTILLIVNLLFFFLSLLIVVGYWIFSFFKPVKGKFLTICIITNYILLFIMPFILLKGEKEQLIGKITGNYIYAVIIAIALVAFHCLLLQMYPSILRSFNKPEIKKYQVERIVEPANELGRLYFLYMLDNERHVMSESANLKKISERPFYIYFPKENALIKYFKNN
jgi:hypothetical protein